MAARLCYAARSFFTHIYTLWLLVSCLEVKAKESDERLLQAVFVIALHKLLHTTVIPNYLL